MKKTLKTTALLATALLLPTMASAATSTDKEILQKLEYLTNKVTAQQEHIDALEGKLDDSGTGGSTIKLANKAIDQLKIKADMRLRYEYRDRERDGKNDDTKNRFRTRLRLGGVWQNKAENFEIGVGLATGGSDATSTNATWSGNKVFETTDIRVDYAYAKHKFGDFAITAGQQKNPYKTSWVLWDSDVRPAGVTLHYGAKTGPFVTAGGYAVRYYNGGENKDNDNTGMLGAGQFGWNTKIGNIKVLAAAGLQYWESTVADNYYTVGDDYSFTIGDIYTKVSVPVGNVKLSAFAQVWDNFGADGNVGEGVLGGTLDPEDENIGWIVGVEAKTGNLKLRANYTQVGADSLFGDVSDSDFGSGISNTDIEGFELEAIYGFSKNLAVALAWNSYEVMERNLNDNAELYQLDMKYKF